MKRYILTNAFSINMLATSCTVSFLKVDSSWLEAISVPYRMGFQVINAIGHADLAALVANEEERLIGNGLPKPERATLVLTPEDYILVAQYTGPRLPEGTTSLPEGAKIEYWEVKVS